MKVGYFKTRRWLKCIKQGVLIKRVTHAIFLLKRDKYLFLFTSDLERVGLTIYAVTMSSISTPLGAGGATTFPVRSVSGLGKSFSLSFGSFLGIRIPMASILGSTGAAGAPTA